MAVHMVVVGKLKLLQAGGHGRNWQLLAALLGPFAVKLPFATCLPSTWADIAVSLRLFLFRLQRILFGDDDVAVRSGSRRWHRALRLLHERAVTADTRRLLALGANDEMLNAAAMFAL